MKKAQNSANIRSYKTKKKEKVSEIKGLFFLLGLLSVLLIVENFFAIVALILPVGIEKAFAKEVQDVASVLSPTVTSLPVASSSPLFSVATLVKTTPTPTPANILQTTSEVDFCLDVPILIYHHIQPLDEARRLGHAQLTVDSKIFDEQMHYLVEHGYQTITSEQVALALRSHQQLPPKSVVVTLDDGYDDFYNYAFPIAKKHNVKMDFMISAGLIGNPGYMTWDQLREIAQNSLISIYNHTWSHAALGDSDLATIEREVMTANDQLEQKLNKKITIFTYPYGSFGKNVIEFLSQRGFIGGISTLEGTMQCKSYVMTLHRARIGNAPLSFYRF